MTPVDLTRRPTRLVQLHPGPRPDLGIKHGDCARTALAMVLGMRSADEVPHYETWAETDAWLRRRGAQVIHMPLPCKTPECVEEHLPTYLRGSPALLQGRTSEGYPHEVAVIDNKMVDTVDWSNGHPLSQPDVDGLFWLTVIVPLRCAA